MAFDTYIKIEGVEGEATAKGFEKQFEILSFSWGAANPSSVGSGSTGLTAGKVSLTPFNFMKHTDKSSPRLFSACCKGEHFPTAVVSMRKATGQGGQGVYLTYKFSDVLVESVHWSGSPGGDDTPMESITLAFGKIDIEYMSQGKDGKLVVAGQASWDLVKVTD